MKTILKNVKITAKKSMSFLLAFSIILSVCMISGFSVGVSATTGSGQKIYINLSQNSTWKNISNLTVRFANSGNTVLKTDSVTKSNGVFEVTAPSGASKIEISSAPFGLPDETVPNGMRRIVLRATSVNGNRYSTPCVHYYESNDGHAASTWPGAKMNRINGTDYYYYDIDDSYAKLNFSDNGNSQTQTSDLTINTAYSSNVSYYNGSGWVNPYIKVIDVSSISNRNTEFYLQQDGTFKESKYLSILSDQSANGNLTFNTVFVINENWESRSEIYATYDYNDPYRATVTLTRDTVNGVTVFKGKIPDGAVVKFHPSKSNTTVASSPTSYPTDSGYDKNGYTENTATYKITSSYENWGKFSEINDVNYDAVVQNRFSQSSNIIGVDATYFDYLSDNERDYGYLNNYTLGYNDGYHTWFPFYNFNKYVSDIASKNSRWSYPLYFGNFYKEGNQYGYSDAIKDLTRYYDGDYRYAVNNSNGLSEKHQSIQGLAFSKLDKDGDIQAANGVKMPYFDADALSTAKWNNERVAKVFKSYFPFKATTDSSGVTEYTFDSTGANDNVYFTWNGTTPKYVNYGSGTSYGVQDAAKLFGNEFDGWGIFPFNNSSNTKTQVINENSGGLTISKDEFLIRSDSSIYYLWLFEGTSGDKEISITNKETRNGNSYFVVKSSELGNYKKCIFKPNAGGNWSGQSGDLTIADLLGKAWKTDGTAYSDSSGTTYTRGGNDNLDFGFGIRLDIDFRVPENGTVDGTTYGTPVKFDYSGDDDLWVYIGEEENGADAELVLDLGGDHKQASGTINFKDMSATANSVYANFGGSTSLPTVPSNEFWVKTGSYTDFCVYTWGSSTTYIHPYVNQDGYYKFRSSDFPSGNTGAIFCKWQNVGDGKLSGDLSLSSLYGNIWNADGSSYSGSSSTNLGEVVNYFNGSTSGNPVHLSPNKTYHMVVFYMERGLAESNFKVGFTMTPANNDLRVSKTLDTSGVVSEIASDLKANETFDYTISDGTSSQNGKTYKLNGREVKSLDAGGNFNLKDQDVADFNSTFKTGSKMTVNESLTNNALSYDTSWNLYDDLGDLIKSSTSQANNTQSQFDLINPNDESDDAFLSLDYINTIKTTTLDITKEVYDEDGSTPYDTNQQFTFNLLIDLDGDGSKYTYKPYPIEYKIDEEHEVYSLHSNGDFNIRNGQTVKLTGLPVGASYKLQEYTSAGFKPYNVSVNNKSAVTFNGALTGKTGTDKTVKIGNIINPTNSEITINKTLDGLNYSGSKFKYVLSGLDIMKTNYPDPENSGEFLNTLSTAGRSQTVNTPENGEVTFDDSSVLSFVQPGYYRFKITESFADGVTEDEKNDYIMDDSTILVEIQVDSTGTPQTPNFFIVPSSEISGDMEDSEYAKFFNDNTYRYSGSTPAFTNTTRHGSVTVNKKDQSDNNVADTVFGLIKVSEADIISDSALQTIIKNDEHIIKETTNSDGAATFSNLLIFKDGKGEFTTSGDSVEWSSTSDDYISGTSTYQTYCLFEYSPAEGYNPSYVKQYFTLPKEGKYEVTFDYVDGAITVPNASGEGMNIFFVVGLGVVGTGALLAAGCLTYTKVQRRRRRAVQNVRPK